MSKAWALQVGDTRDHIVAVLGAPAEEAPTFLRYSLVGLKGFPGMPGPIGTQVFPAASIPLKNGRMAGAIEWAWMDTIGSAPRTY